MAGEKGAVLVTGSSSGLGRAAALRLASNGWVVFAGVRTAESATRLRRDAAGTALRPVQLDVTSADSITLARKEIHECVGPGGLTGLVNNAGTCLAAPLECADIDDFRAELEVNVVGVAAVTQAFLPLLRAAAPGGKTPIRGRIVMIGSGVGWVAPPFLGMYAASQFGKRGMADALRRELAPAGVTVSQVEPGAVRTPIWDKIAEHAEVATEPELYRTAFRKFLSENNSRAMSSRTSPEDVARAVEHALTARRPRLRYRVGPDSAMMGPAVRLVPEWLLDRAVMRNLGLKTSALAAERE
ncbi:SDR family oxidoreductase [Nocardia niigatensis]|uniref:SDR family oxidoreductase n=1 Tax=Nocardia niigatensis TaxID=209249 RepID=UPI0002F57B73|nr:SDR family oxidoreductase [Nocardia niigatensis]